MLMMRTIQVAILQLLDMAAVVLDTNMGTMAKIHSVKIHFVKITCSAVDPLNS